MNEEKKSIILQKRFWLEDEIHRVRRQATIRTNELFR
jgi:hypothetical protein